MWIASGESPREGCVPLINVTRHCLLQIATLLVPRLHSRALPFHSVNSYKHWQSVIMTEPLRRPLLTCLSVNPMFLSHGFKCASISTLDFSRPLVCSLDTWVFSSAESQRISSVINTSMPYSSHQQKQYCPHARHAYSMSRCQTIITSPEGSPKLK